jgi:hypothetical protein
MFLSPVDPVSSNCPDYFDVITRPMDLGTVRSNLDANKYHSVAAWKADVDLVWRNSMEYNSTNSALLLLTKDLQKHFLDLSKNISDSYRQTWKSYLVQMHEELTDCIREVLKARAAGR